MTVDPRTAPEVDAADVVGPEDELPPAVPAVSFDSTPDNLRGYLPKMSR